MIAKGRPWNYGDWPRMSNRYAVAVKINRRCQATHTRCPLWLRVQAKRAQKGPATNHDTL